MFDITRSYKDFVLSFMGVNSMSIISYSVGQHNDHFHQGGESLENKITLVVPALTSKLGLGRGGSLWGDDFVFALLDWQNGGRSARSFYVQHSNQMGLGAPAPTGAQQLINQYFTANEQNPNGQQWIATFNHYMATHGNHQPADGAAWFGQEGAV